MLLLVIYTVVFCTNALQIPGIKSITGTTFYSSPIVTTVNWVRCHRYYPVDLAFRHVTLEILMGNVMIYMFFIDIFDRVICLGRLLNLTRYLGTNLKKHCSDA
jgi:hypothetical protein